MHLTRLGADSAIVPVLCVIQVLFLIRRLDYFLKSSPWMRSPFMGLYIKTIFVVSFLCPSQPQFNDLRWYLLPDMVEPCVALVSSDHKGVSELHPAPHTSSALNHPEGTKHHRCCKWPLLACLSIRFPMMQHSQHIVALSVFNSAILFIFITW